MEHRGLVYQNFWQLVNKIRAPLPKEGPGILDILPTELVVQILQHLSTPEIVLCQRISRSFRDIITASAELQHKTTCYTAHVTNGPNNKLGIVELISRISAWESTWKTLQVANHPMVLRLNEVPWNYRSGSIFSCITRSNRGISFYQLPSKQREIPYVHWTITDLGYEPVFVCHDYTQDLVVTAENMEDAFGPCARLHLLHDKTGEHHLAARKQYLQLPTAIPFVGPNDHDLHIFGDLLGLIVRVEGELFNHRGSVMTKHLLVYNWKTGALLKNLNGELLSHEIVFVDDRHFLVPFMPHTLPGAYLAVVDCYRTDPDTNEAMTRGKIQDVIFKHASLLLQLPPVRDAPHIDYQEVHAMSSTGTQAERLHPPGRPFYVDYTKRIFVLSMLIGETWGRDRMHYTLLVPAPAILSRLGASGPGTPPMRAAEQHRCMMLPWAAWAPDARFMEDEMEDICSTRYLTSTRIDERRLVTVYDFASAPALLRDLRADGGGGGNTLSEPFSVPDPVPVPDEGGVFERCGVLTGAPCRRTVTDIALPDIRMVTDFISQGHRTVRLYEDGLVVYGPTIDSEVHVYAI